MAPSRVHVVAVFNAKPDRIAELRSLLHGLVAPTRREPGCIRYDLCQSDTDPADFIFIEEWDTAAALDAHGASPHLRAARLRFPEFAAEAPDVRRYTLVTDPADQE